MTEDTGYYARQAQYYDAIYESQGKDYQQEAQTLRAIIDAHRQAAGDTLLDVACGTGGHLTFLREWYRVEGLDMDAHMLRVAGLRFPDLAFHQADMTAFDLGRQYDIVTCLFSAIGYVQTVDRLRQAIGCMSSHLQPGGVLAVEPWFAPQQWRTGLVHATFVDQPGLKIARMSVSERRDDIAVINFHFLVATPEGVETFSELHELGLFTHQQYLEAFTLAGLSPNYDPQGITGRGLYIGVKAT